MLARMQGKGTLSLQIIAAAMEIFMEVHHKLK
jgi:hypothetical protein